jgi:hypothetical protein
MFYSNTSASVTQVQIRNGEFRYQKGTPTPPPYDIFNLWKTFADYL